MEDNNVLSRRKLLKSAGYSLAGLTLAGTVGALVSGCSQQPAASEPAPAEATTTPQWPFTYAKLDPSVAEKKAYDAYKEDG